MMGARIGGVSGWLRSAARSLALTAIVLASAALFGSRAAGADDLVTGSSTGQSSSGSVVVTASGSNQVNIVINGSQVTQTAPSTDQCAQWLQQWLFGDDPDDWGDLWPCPAPTTPPAASPANASAASPAAQPSSSAASASAGTQQTFRLCGTPDPQTEQAIAQLIAGRGYSAQLAGRTDGCADLTISVAPDAVLGTGSQQSTALSVSSGSQGNGASIAVQIVSASGVTHVHLGSAS